MPRSARVFIYFERRCVGESSARESLARKWPKSLRTIFGSLMSQWRGWIAFALHPKTESKQESSRPPHMPAAAAQGFCVFFFCAEFLRPSSFSYFLIRTLRYTTDSLSTLHTKLARIALNRTSQSLDIVGSGSPHVQTNQARLVCILSSSPCSFRSDVVVQDVLKRLRLSRFKREKFLVVPEYPGVSKEVSSDFGEFWW